MKKTTIFLFFLILFFLPLVLFFFWWNQVSSPVDPQSKEVKILIVPQGWGVEPIGQQLKKKGLIKNVLAFKLIVYKEKIAQQLQAGDFQLSPSMSLFEIAQNLTHGTVDVWLRIPEGLRREEIAVIIADSLASAGKEFNRQDFLAKTVKEEGFLFPDTYLIPKNASPEKIVRILKDNFEKKFNSLEVEANLTKRQIVILASLIEREAKHDKDRPLIAGILLKRLRKGWSLDIDATVQYAKANIKCRSLATKCNWWPVVTAEDIKEIDSPYNTYKNLSLPPAPICNPGLTSLRAAANPQLSDYWFYLSDPSGNIHYAKTLKEQEINIAKYLN